MKTLKVPATVWLADGVEEMEAVIVLDVLRRGGVDARGMSVSGDIAVHASRDIRLTADLPWDEDWILDSELLVVPGGMGGTEALMGNPLVLKQLRRGMENERLIGAVCAGPLVLSEAGILENVKLTCYPGLQDKLKAGTWVDEPVVRDGKIITSQGPATAMRFAVELVRAVRGDSIADEVAKALLLA